MFASSTSSSASSTTAARPLRPSFSTSSSSSSRPPLPTKRPLPLLSPLRSPQQHTLPPSLSSLLIPSAGPAGGGVGSKAGGAAGEEVNSPGRALLLGIGILYVALILLLPAANVFYQAFRNGFGPFIENVLDPDFLHAVKMTFLMAICAVPINTVWGVAAALLIARNEFSWKPALLSILDLPFSISPVVAGMMLVLLYGRQGLFAPVLKVRRMSFFLLSERKMKKKTHLFSFLFLSFSFSFQALDIRILYAFPGMVLATLFVTLPYVARELVPVLVRGGKKFFLL